MTNEMTAVFVTVLVVALLAFFLDRLPTDAGVIRGNVEDVKANDE